MARRGKHKFKTRAPAKVTARDGSPPLHRCKAVPGWCRARGQKAIYRCGGSVGYDYSSRWIDHRDGWNRSRQTSHLSCCDCVCNFAGTWNSGAHFRGRAGKSQIGPAAVPTALCFTVQWLSTSGTAVLARKLTALPNNKTAFNDR